MGEKEVGRTSLDERRARAVGTAMIVAGVVLNEWCIAWLATPDGVIDDPIARVVIWAFDVAAIVSGIVVRRRLRLPRGRHVLRAAALTLLALLALESALHVATRLRHRDQGTLDPRALLSPYQGAEWARELYEELGPERGTENNFTFHPVLGWTLLPYRGRYVQVDERGIRRTWNPADLPDDAPTLYVLGGSTVWGTGARDDYTLPSALSRALARAGRPMEVHNYGQLAYTFPKDQDLLQLILLLKDGHRPDHVILYNGANDVFGAYRNGFPGGTLPWRALVSRDLSPTDHLKIGVNEALERYSLLYSGLRRLRPRPSGFSEAGARMTDDELRGLARRVVQNYETTRELVAVLARGYGFRYLTLWQPVAFTEAELLEEERVDPRTGDEALAKLHRFALEELRARHRENFHDLSGVLRDRRQTYYLDYRHLSEQGNGVVADRIAELLLEQLRNTGADLPERQ